MTVLVTGGAGYIGSHTVRALREAGRAGRRARLDGVRTARRRHRRPARRRRHPRRRPRRAGLRRARRDAARPLRRLQVRRRVDGEPDAVLAQQRRRHGDARRRGDAPGVREVVFSSSCSVYGTPAEVPVVESAPITPESVYAETKATVERILALVRRDRAVCARCRCATSTPPAPASTGGSARTGRSRSTSSRW